MVTLRTDRKGNEYVHTTIEIPRYLRDFARKQKISMSSVIRKHLEQKMNGPRGNGQ